MQTAIAVRTSLEDSSVKVALDRWRKRTFHLLQVSHPQHTDVFGLQRKVIGCGGSDQYVRRVKPQCDIAAGPGEVSSARQTLAEINDALSFAGSDHRGSLRPWLMRRYMGASLRCNSWKFRNDSS